MRTFNLLWVTVFSMELPDKAGNLYEEYIQILFNFANAYTVDSIRNGIIQAKKAENKEATPEQLRELGYSEKDILEYLG